MTKPLYVTKVNQKTKTITVSGIPPNGSKTISTEDLVKKWIRKWMRATELHLIYRCGCDDCERIQAEAKRLRKHK